MIRGILKRIKNMRVEIQVNLVTEVNGGTSTSMGLGADVGVGKTTRDLDV